MVLRPLRVDLEKNGTFAAGFLVADGSPPAEPPIQVTPLLGDSGLVYAALLTGFEIVPNEVNGASISDIEAALAGHPGVVAENES
jgi:hypothetical protein